MSHSFLKGFLFGSVVAAATALLTTPRSGKENRAMLQSYVDETTGLVGDVTGNVAALQDAVETLSTEGVALIKGVTEEIAETIKEYTHEIKPHVNRIQDGVEDLAETFPSENSESSPS